MNKYRIQGALSMFAIISWIILIWNHLPSVENYALGLLWLPAVFAPLVVFLIEVTNQ